MGGGEGVGSLFRRPARNSGALYTPFAELSFFMEENTYITLERHDKDDLFYMNIVHGHSGKLIRSIDGFIDIISLDLQLVIVLYIL